MNLEKVIFAFTIILATTANLSFFLGEIDNPAHHHVYGLYAAIFVNAVATILKFGDRSHIGGVLLASGVAATLLLVMAAGIWGYAVHVAELGLTGVVVASIVSLSGGALLANLVSVVLLIVEIILLRR